MKYIQLVALGLLVGLFDYSQTSAQQAAQGWMEGPLYVTETSPMPNRQVGCMHEMASRTVTANGSAMEASGQVCVVQGDRLSALHKNTYLGNDRWFNGVYAIKLPEEQRYVDLIDTGEQIEHSIYATESDTLVEVLVRGNATVLRILPNVSGALVPGRVHPTYGIVEYGFDYSMSQEYTFAPSQLSDVNNGTISTDGRFVYASLAEKNIDENGDVSFGQLLIHKIDTQLRATEAFVIPSAPTGSQITAVSPSGRYVVAARSIIDTQDCRTNAETGYRVCKARSYAATLDSATGYDKVGVSNSENFVSVRFSEGETSITIEPTNPLDNWVPSGKFYRISFVPQVEYLALGDSYSSGEGDLGRQANGQSYYINDTGGYEGCHLSSRSYPFLLGKALGDNDMFTESVACSGALVLPDFYGEGRYDGQSGENRDKSVSDLADAQRTALQNFTPGQIRQLEFVKEHRPKMLTFTGGGNDVGFADILEYCASSYQLFGKIPINETCAFAKDEQLRSNLNGTIDTQYVFNKEFIEEIKRVSPETEIYMVGYPQFVKSNGTHCFRGSPLLNDDEIEFIRQSVVRLNNVLMRVASAADVYYIDIEDSLEAGQICQGSEYMTGPIRAIIDNNLNPRKDNNMYHPNAAGHKKMAERIAKQIKEKPGYAIADIPAEENAAQVVRTAVLPSYAGVGSTHTVQVAPGTIKPGGTISGDAYSSKMHLGDYIADATGALTVSVTIPPELGIGKHLFTFTGLDVNDQPVQLQQFVYVTGSDSNDIDGDGIPNEYDPCFAITKWYENDVDICASTQPTPLNGDVSSPKVAKKDFLTNDATTVSWLNGSDGIPTTSELTPSNANTHPHSSIAATKANSGKLAAYWPMLLLTAIIVSGVGLLLYGKRRTN